MRESAFRIAMTVLFSAALMPLQVSAGDWRAQQHVWWNDAEVIEEAIIAGRLIVTEVASTRRDGLVEDAAWSISKLLLLFDSMSSHSALATLADLSSYYLGEAPSEMFSCIVLRKGRTIRPFLVSQLGRRGSCVERFPREDRAESSLCLDENGRKRLIRAVITRIDNHKSCIIEE